MSELAKATVRLTGDISDLQTALSLAHEEMGKAGKVFEELGHTLMLKVTLPLAALGGFAVKEFGEQADAVTRLDAVLQAAGGVTGTTTARIEELAHQLQQTTRFYDDNTIAAASLMATFHQVRNEVGAGNDVFDRAIKASAGLAATMGEDLQSAAFKLGRALEDPANSLMLLRRAGIVFTETEKFQIKTLMEHGQVLEAQRIVLEKVENKTRGVAEAMAKTPFGHFVQMWNAVKDAVKPLGSVLADILMPLADLVKRAANAFAVLPPSIQKVIVVAGILLASLGPLMIVFANVQKILVFVRAFSLLQGVGIGLSTVLSGLKTAFFALFSPLGLITAAVGILAIMWLKAEAAAAEAAAASQAATDKLVAGFSALSPEQVQRRVTRFGVVIDQYKSKVESLQNTLNQAAMAQAGVSDATRTTMPPKILGPQLSPAQKAQTQEKIQAYNELIGRLQVMQQALKDLGVGFEDAAQRANEQLIAALSQADLDLNNARVSAGALGKVIGPTFNVAAANADALQAHLHAVADAMAKAGKSQEQIAAALRQEGKEFLATQMKAAIDDANLSLLNAQQSAKVLGQVLGPTFSQSAAEAAALRSHIDSVIKSMEQAGKSTEEIVNAVRSLGDAWQAADLRAHLDEANRSLGEALKTAHVMKNVFGGLFSESRAQADALRAYMEATVQAMIAAGASVDEVTAAIRGMGEEITRLEAKAQIGEFFKDQMGRATDAIVDFAFGAKISLGEFIRQMLADFAKLILRIELLKIVMGIGGGSSGGGSGTSVMGDFSSNVPLAADGGIFGSGSLAVVGEAGPELVQAGRRGMTVTPLSAAAGTVGEGGASTPPVNVNVNVQAIDQRGVMDFFDQNEALVANAMFRAFQKSTMLRKRMG